jgi:hypothetical protein
VGVRKRQSWQQSHRHDRKPEAGITTRRSPHFMPRRLTDAGDFILVRLRLLGGDRR